MVQRVVQGKPDDAIALLRMNLEFNPQSAKTYALLGFAYTRKVDDASAITNLQKSLELDPANAMVRGQLEQIARIPAPKAAAVGFSSRTNRQRIVAFATPLRSVWRTGAIEPRALTPPRGYSKEAYRS
jgi:tetratricopeptide (TPR) repeat protein